MGWEQTNIQIQDQDVYFDVSENLFAFIGKELIFRDYLENQEVLIQLLHFIFINHSSKFPHFVSIISELLHGILLTQNQIGNLYLELKDLEDSQQQFQHLKNWAINVPSEKNKKNNMIEEQNKVELKEITIQDQLSYLKKKLCYGIQLESFQELFKSIISFFKVENQYQDLPLENQINWVKKHAEIIFNTFKFKTKYSDEEIIKNQGKIDMKKPLKCSCPDRNNKHKQIFENIINFKSTMKFPDLNQIKLNKGVISRLNNDNETDKTQNLKQIIDQSNEFQKQQIITPVSLQNEGASIGNMLNIEIEVEQQQQANLVQKNQDLIQNESQIINMNYVVYQHNLDPQDAQMDSNDKEDDLSLSFKPFIQSQQVQNEEICEIEILAEDLIEPEYKKYESQAEFEKIRRQNQRKEIIKDQRSNEQNKQIQQMNGYRYRNNSHENNGNNQRIGIQHPNNFNNHRNSLNSHTFMNGYDQSDPLSNMKFSELQKKLEEYVEHESKCIPKVPIILNQLDEIKIEKFANNIADLAFYIDTIAREKNIGIEFVSDYFKYNIIDLKPLSYQNDFRVGLDKIYKCLLSLLDQYDVNRTLSVLPFSENQIKGYSTGVEISFYQNAKRKKNEKKQCFSDNFRAQHKYTAFIYGEAFCIKHLLRLILNTTDIPNYKAQDIVLMFYDLKNTKFRTYVKQALEKIEEDAKKGGNIKLKQN